MFDAYLMITADNRALQEAPDAFHSVSVNVATNPFLRAMANAFVARVHIFNSPIGRKLISVDRLSVGCGVVVNELVKRARMRLERLGECFRAEYLRPTIARGDKADHHEGEPQAEQSETKYAEYGVAHLASFPGASSVPPSWRETFFLLTVIQRSERTSALNRQYTSNRLNCRRSQSHEGF